MFSPASATVWQTRSVSTFVTEPLGPPEALGALKCDWSIGIQLYSWLCRLGWPILHGVWCISLLTCVAVCKSVQHGIIKSTLLPHSWGKSLSIASSTRRILQTRHHASKEMEFIVFPTQKQPLAISSHNTWHKSRPKRCVQLLFHPSTSSLSGTKVGAVGEWETKTVWWHLLHQEKLEEVAHAGC